MEDQRKYTKAHTKIPFKKLDDTFISFHIIYNELERLYTRKVREEM